MEIVIIELDKTEGKFNPDIDLELRVEKIFKRIISLFRSVTHAFGNKSF